MSARLRYKKAVKQALTAKIVVLPDIHGKEPKLVKKVRLAVERQIARGEREATLIGDWIG